MSGPKVVRIVTREEIIATCQGHIASLVAAIEQWNRVGKRNEVLEFVDIQRAESRIAAMRDLLARDLFVEVQKQVPQEIAFLRADMDSRIERAVEEKSIARNVSKRRMRAAQALANALLARSLEVPAPLLDPGSYPDEDLQNAINAGFSSLDKGESPSEATKRQRDLAAHLSGDEQRATLDDWLAVQHQISISDPVIDSIERRYEELKAFAPEHAAPFGDRISKASQLIGPHRTLLMDSLAADIAAARKRAGEAMAASVELQSLQSQLETVKTPLAVSIAAQAAALLALSPEMAEVASLIALARSTLDATLRENAAADKRRAILEGLGNLGYEVKEGMQTAWVENGKVVLKSAKTPGYGVEIGGDPSNNMQLRTVGFSDGRVPSDGAADVAAEVEFCGDFSALQATLSATGTELSIIKALGVGVTPVKRVQIAEKEPATEVVMTTITSRQV